MINFIIANVIILSVVLGQTETIISLEKWYDNLFSNLESNRPCSGSSYDNLIVKYSEYYGIEPAFLKAMIHVESSFNPKAVSRKGAIGLCQLMPPTARELGVNPWNVDQNVKGGAKYIRFLLDTYNQDTKLALYAYNCGMTRVDSGRIPKETRKYANDVIRWYKHYKYKCECG